MDDLRQLLVKYGEDCRTQKRKYFSDTDDALAKMLKQVFVIIQASKPQPDLDWAKDLFADGYEQALEDWLADLEKLFSQKGVDTE